MAISAAGSAICLALFVKLESPAGQLAANCFQCFLQNIFYAVLYAYRYTILVFCLTISPEVFPTYVRGTGVGFASMLARICAIVISPSQSK